MQSKINGGTTEILFSARVLNKYDVSYYRCTATGFIQTEEPYWLPEAYSAAITKLDIGLAYRNMQLAEKISKILSKSFNYNGLFLDYAGGYGLFTRLMRDKGYNFYNTDDYCQNLFAEQFDLAKLPAGTRFELTTAFEVFEHLPNPLAGIETMLSYSDNLLFSTELQPANVKSLSDWWYFAPETGQHIAFYTIAALSALAKQLGYYFYTDGSFLHLFSKTEFDKNPLILPKEPFLVRKARKLIRKYEKKNFPHGESLMMTDYEAIKKELNGE